MFSLRRLVRKPSDRSQTQAGFTLIELLVVILIILILMAALMPVYNKILLKAKKEATQNMIAALTASLERYKDAFEVYPPSPASGTEDDGTLYLTLNGPTGRGVAANVGTPREKHFEPFLTMDKTYLRPDGSGSKLVICDSWGSPIHYFNCKSYVEDSSGNPKFCHNPAGVDIYSVGPDKKKDDDTTEPGTEEVKDRSKRTPEQILKDDDISNF